jgi:hypothetical protein
MRLIVFSGGECFLLGKDLDAAIETATKLGLITRCVTNGFWATSEETASRRLVKLKKAGLKELNFSTGDFHQKWVPQCNIASGVVSSVRLGIPTVVMIELQKERKVTAANFRAEPRIQEMMKKTEGSEKFKIIESPWMPMSLDKEVPQRDERYLNANNADTKKGCTSVLNTIVVTPTGRLGVCCGLSRELIPELNLDLTLGMSLQERYQRAAADFIKIWLFVEGPERILAWAASKDKPIEWEGKYAHHCHACLALFEDERIRDIIRS